MKTMMQRRDFLPVTAQEMQARGWEQADFVYVSGDAYVDHPSFGAAIISRVLEDAGYRVAMLCQPNWKDPNDFRRFGRPRLGFMVSSGNIDSMVAHYTAAKRRRSTDAYSPGGKAGLRPDRAVSVYTKILKKLYPDCPVVIGGLEASLRRFAHYDYWSDSIRPSVLIESGADLLIYGMGEKAVCEIARQLDSGVPAGQITDVRGTVYKVDVHNTPYTGTEVPSLENVRASKKEYAKSCRVEQDEQDAIYGRAVKQRHGQWMVVQNPPMPALETEELDHVYALGYQRTWHPMYTPQGGVPGLAEVEFSITHNRGCFGGCNFCSIAFHQGRYVTKRSKESVVAEAKLLTAQKNFKGYIHDVGGPTANFRNPSCTFQKTHGLCKGKKCLAPVCPNLEVDHSEYLDILRTLRSLPGVKKVFIRSGIRYDYLLRDPDDTFFKEMVRYHISGQLKVAPEHCSARVLDKMGKPHIETYERFCEKYFSFTDKIGKEQYLVPYLMSSHPGSTLEDAVELALFLKNHHVRPEQVQDFYPTPGTISTCMFYTELDPYTMQPVYVAKSAQEKAMQRALLQYYDPKNHELVRRALLRCGRRDLIGNGPHCLVPSAPGYSAGRNAKQKGRKRFEKR